MNDEVQTDQATEQSALERIASKFGLPQQQASSDETGTETGEMPEFAEIEWKGEKFQIPGKLKDAFMQHTDYTQKTQALADRGRQLDLMREAGEQAAAERSFSQSIVNEQREIAVIEAYLAQASAVDWSKMSLEQMMRQKAEIDNIKERREALNKSITDKRGAFDSDLKTKIGELRTKAREIASKSITGFSEETEKAIRTYAKGEGLADGEIDNVLLDPRSFNILWKASQFDKIKASTGRATTQTERTLRPGASSERMPAKTAAALNFRKAMNGAKTSGQRAEVIEAKLASGSIFSKR